MPREFLSFVIPTSFPIACARYPIDEIQYDITAASLVTRSWPSQTEHDDFWPGYGPSQDFSNISSLQDNFSDVASEDMRRPVPDFDEEVDVEEGLGQPSGDEDPPQEPEQTGTELDESFQPEDADNLRRLIGDMCAATPPVLFSDHAMGTPRHQLSVRRRDTHRADPGTSSSAYLGRRATDSFRITSHCQGQPH